MDISPHFNDFLDGLAESCTYRGQEPWYIDFRGPDKIILADCGHTLDATEWVDF
jgi:hypothetical protein